MSAAHFVPFFLVFGGSAVFLWLIGAACFYRSAGWRSLFHAPWLGYGLLVGSLQITHLFSPVDRRFSFAFVVIGSLAALVVLMPSLLIKGWPRKAAALRGLGSLILLAAVALIVFVPVFNSCTKEMNRYDLGLYYLKTIRWIEGFAIVPGLANVQDHLGFNQSAFLATSFFDSLMPDRLFLVGGILPWLGLTLSLFAIVRLALSRFVREEHVQSIEVAYAVSLPAWIFIFVVGDTSSASPDCTSACLMLHFFLIFACFVLSGEQERRDHLAEILFVGALCVCIKLNSLGLVAGVLALCIAMLLLKRPGLLLFQRRVAVMSVLAALILATWMGRGILISGYPFFPSSAMAMPVVWRTPVTRVDGFRNLVIGWARDRENFMQALTTLRWGPTWLSRVAPELTNRFTWPAQTGFTALVTLASFAVFAPVLRRNLRNILILAAPLVLYMAFWFLTAPEPRYFGPSVWIFAMCPALTFIAGGARAGLVASTANLCLNALPIFFVASEFHWSWSRPEPRLPQVKVVETAAVASIHGVIVWVPAKGDQTFDSPIPSAQAPVPGLALLNPQKGIAGGFKCLEVEKLGSADDGD
jgi:hypothetical protein